MDYDILNDKSRNYFSSSNLSPLWLKAYDPDKATYIATKVLEYINKTEIDNYPGGVPNTLEHSGNILLNITNSFTTKIFSINR